MNDEFDNEFWMEFLDKKIMCCGLCGNHGIIDTTNLNIKTPAGYKVGVRTYCICPNGRAMKKAGWKL